jgi:2'-5' RNA ligase
MRMFVAVTPSSEAVEHLEDFLEPRRAAGPDLRWSAPEQWHLTLAFMASVPDRALDDLVERLTRAAARCPVFAAALRAGGAFPDVGRGRVLYVGIDVGEQQERLRRLADGARAAANRAGAPVDGARLHPHVTLARSGRPVEMSRWVRLLDTYAGPSWPVDRLTLFASHLGEGPRRRPRHEVVASVPLGPG